MQATLQSINYDKTVHGCLMFRPLPSFLDEKALCNMLSPEKDIDGISLCVARLRVHRLERRVSSCTAQACVEILDFYKIPLVGKHVVVIGRSLVVGKPVSMMLLRRNASVTICHSRTENLPELCRTADIVICAVGRAHAFGKEYFRAGQTVLDVGINFDSRGTLCGDVNFDEVGPSLTLSLPFPVVSALSRRVSPWRMWWMPPRRWRGGRAAVRRPLACAIRFAPSSYRGPSTVSSRGSC